MSTALRIHSDKTRGVAQPKKATVYTEFILWTAMPSLEKRTLGIETQKAFAEYYKVSEDTLSLWKTRPDFETRVDAILKAWSIGKTPDVVHGIYRAAVKGNPMSQMLWLQYFKGWHPKTEVEHTTRQEIGVNDIRFLIEALPEPLKTKHYGNLRELLDDAVAVRDARDAEISDWDARPAEPILDTADHDAPDVQGEQANEVAARHPHGLRADMERPVPAYNYQSASWWG